MTGAGHLLRVGVVTAALGVVAIVPPASAAQGILEASIIDCETFDGELLATVGVSVTNATPDTPVWLRA